MVWSHVYDPLSSPLLSTLVATLPLVALLGFPAAGSTRFLDQPRPKTYTAIKDKKFPINPLLLG